MEKIIELIIDEDNEISGIQAISVVENPAIEEDFIALKEHKEVRLAEVDAEKRILMGPALIPNKKYLEKVIMKIAIILFTFLKIQLEKHQSYSL